jgi:DNA-binding YbaB/EbfC family protein
MMFSDMGKILRLAGQMKQKLPQFREQLARSEYTAEVGDGAVRATVNGRLELVDIKIRPDALGAEGGIDTEALEDLVKAGVSAAQRKAAAAVKEAMKQLTGGMDLPGMDGMLP